MRGELGGAGEMRFAHLIGRYSISSKDAIARSSSWGPNAGRLNGQSSFRSLLLTP